MFHMGPTTKPSDFLKRLFGPHWNIVIRIRRSMSLTGRRAKLSREKKGK